ncbi:MAG: hypothetical protein RIA63_09430 [Cyclobacteriaceae bacterium]
MKVKCYFFLIFFFFFFTSPAQVPYPLEEDVATLDGIIKAYYEVVSGPKGPKQTERDKSLHHAYANVMVTGVTMTGERFLRMMTLPEFHANTPQDAFYEKEIHRITETFGNVTHVWSTYEYTDQLNGPIMGRGINSIQLYNDGERWWILGWVYDSERKSNPLPEKYLPK